MAMETETCLRQALGERIKPVMCINQLDQVSQSRARLARAQLQTPTSTCVIHAQAAFASTTQRVLRTQSYAP
jgi:translation elongation factor EF-G